VNHGSRFARSLGFYDDTAWPSDMADPGEGYHDPSLLPKIKKHAKAKKARRRSSSGSSGAASPSQSTSDQIGKLHPEDTHVPWDTASDFVDDFLEVDDDSSYADSDALSVNSSDDEGFEERSSFTEESSNGSATTAHAGDLLAASSPTQTSSYLEMNIMGGRPHHLSPIAHAADDDVDESSTPISTSK
jgi:hypothetical protein